MKLLKAIFITLVSIIALQAAPASEATIRELMELTGSGKLGIQVMEQMIPSMKRMVPDAPESFWDDMMAEINADELIALIVPIYQKHFTEQDIEDLITFYKTPAGKKFIEKTPAISQESMLAGQMWGQQIAQKIMVKYQALEK